MSAEKGSKKWADELVSKTRKVTRDVDVAFLRLAELFYLSRIPAGGDPAAGPVHEVFLGYKHFKDYVDHEFGFSWRRAYTLVRVHEWMHDVMKAPPEMVERLHKLTEAKLVHLSAPGLMSTAEDLERWVAQAEVSTASVLEQTIREYVRNRQVARVSAASNRKHEEVLEEDKSHHPALAPAPVDFKEVDAAVPIEVQTKIKKTFTLSPDQYANVMLALTLSAELSRTKDDSRNLDLIATDFMLTTDHRKAGADVKVKYLVQLAEKVGVPMVLLDSESGKIAYGWKHLEALLHAYPIDLTRLAADVLMEMEKQTEPQQEEPEEELDPTEYAA